MGGLERCIARLANGLDRNKFQPYIICLGSNGTAAEWITVGDVDNDLRVIRSLATVLREKQIDIVHSHNWGTLVETSLARQWAGTPVHVHAERGMELEALQASKWKRWLRGRAMRWALQRSNYVIAVAEAVRKHVIERCGKLNCPVHVIPNGVDTPPIDPNGPTVDDIRRLYKIPTDALIVGSVGRLVPVKDFGLAIAAIARLVHEKHDVHLLLVGDGPERLSLEKKATSENISNHVHFAGQRNDVGNWLTAMDIYVNCSLNEGMSQSVLEAMAVGLPLVVTDVGDNAALAGNEFPSSCVVPPSNTELLSEAMRYFLADPSKRQECSSLAISRHADSFSLSQMMDKYESLYEGLMMSVSVANISSRQCHTESRS